MIRVFLGVKLTSDIRETLDVLIEQLKPRLPPINWVRPESIHLTLKFLGSIEPSLVPQLLAELEPIGKTQEMFSLDVKGLGVFPQVKNPRILWVGLVGDIQPLRTLVKEMEVALEPLGFPPEDKAYHPHLALARINRENASVGVALRKAEIFKSGQYLGRLPLTEVTVFQSSLNSSGAVYSSLGSVCLANHPPGS